MSKKKQIIFKVEEKFHREIKIAAANHGITMNLYIAKAIFDRLQKDGVVNEK